ncbi:MAG: hypothetical protein PHO66_06680 [Eubacteriales bacterium]|nr:hypothetical protein [Eubacteriales bacterium]
MADVLAIAGQIFCALSVVLGAVLFVVAWLRKRDTQELFLPVAQRAWWQRPAVHIAIWVVLTRAAIFALGALAIVLAGQDLPDMGGIWAKWDAHHYLHIAQYGYTADASLGDGWLYIVFFPLYPALTALLGRALHSYFWAAVALSWAALYLACLGLYRLCEGEQPGGGMRAVRYLLLFPTALFLGIPYTESLFLALSILCLLLIRRRRWLWAGIAGFFAALTRNAGVLLALSYGVEFLYAQRLLPRGGSAVRDTKQWFKDGLPILLIPLGLGVYLLINHLVYGDALMFMQIQKQHWYQQMQPFYQSIGITIGQLWQSDAAHVYFMWGPQLVTMVLFLAVLPHMVRRLHPTYGIYLLAFAVVSLSPSWLLSFPRYMMGAAPIYLYLAGQGRRRWLDVALCTLFAAGLIYLTVGFVLGYSVV